MEYVIGKLDELVEKIVAEFEIFKHYNKYDDTEQFDKDLDNLLFVVKYHLNLMKTQIICEANQGESSANRDVKSQKVDALIKLHSLAASITCNIINRENWL